MVEPLRIVIDSEFPRIPKIPTIVWNYETKVIFWKEILAVTHQNDSFQPILALICNLKVQIWNIADAAKKKYNSYSPQYFNF